MVIYTVYGIIVSPELNLFYEKAEIYDEDWIRISEDGSETAYKMPMSLPLSATETATFYTILPDTVNDGMYLSINTGKCFTITIEGEEICRFDNRISKLPGNITKTVTVPVRLKETYAGKKLTIVFTNGIYDRRIVNAAYIGPLMGIVIQMSKNYALQLVLATVLALAAIATIGIFAYIEKRDNKNAPLIYLAEGILAICLWVIFDSPLYQLVTGTFFYDGVVGFMLVVTMGFPFLLYFDAITEYKRHTIFRICEVVIVANFVIFTFLHMTRIVSYDKLLIYFDSILTDIMVVILIVTLRNYICQKEKKHKYVMMGMLCLSVFSFIEIVVTILYTIYPFKVDIGGLFVLFGMLTLLFFAILDQVKIFDALKNETQAAIAATKAKSDFLANMSHEIRTPINAIMGMNEMILRECEQENIREYARDVSSASEALLEIVNDILDFSKIEAGKLELVLTDYDLGELLYDVTTLVNMKAEDKGLKFIIHVDEKLPSILHGDEKRIREIITNILNNAVKYTENGFVKLNVTGNVADNTAMLTISISDSGQGIKKEDLESIFEGFTQVNLKKNRTIEGTGLGLSITKRLVELMEGSISVESEYEKGSTFTVSIPQKIVSFDKMGNYIDHRHALAKENGINLKELKIPNAKILVVDDTALNLKVISKILGKTEAMITCVASGDEMLKLIKENYYDIILLDHMMPNMDGIEALKIAKTMDENKCRNTPYIAMTANAIVGAKEMYLEAGFDDYLSKPVRMDELCNILIRYIPNISYSS